jgi:chromate transporter
VIRALRGMGAVTAGLILATALRLFGALERHPLGWWICLALAAAGFSGVALLRWPLPFVLFGLGGLACLITYARLDP